MEHFGTFQGYYVDIFCVRLVYFKAVRYILWSLRTFSPIFGLLYQEKSGWQPRPLEIKRENYRLSADLLEIVGGGQADDGSNEGGWLNRLNGCEADFAKSVGRHFG
jgi:hypothetical protein